MSKNPRSPRFRSNRRVLALVAIAALPLMAATVPASAATDDASTPVQAQGSVLHTVNFDTPGDATWTVPQGSCSPTITVVGGAGGHAENSDPVRGDGTSVAGGDGAEIFMRDYPVVPGDTVSMTIGASAESVSNISGPTADPRVIAAGGGGATTVDLDKPARRFIAGGGGGAAIYKITQPSRSYQAIDGGSAGTPGGSPPNSYSNPSVDGAGQDGPVLAGTGAEGGVGGVGGAGGVSFTTGVSSGSAGGNGMGGAGGPGVYGENGEFSTAGASGGGSGGVGGSGAGVIASGIGGAGGGGGGGYGGGGGGSGTGGGAGGGSLAPAGARIYQGHNHMAGSYDVLEHGSVTFTYVTGDQCDLGRLFEVRNGALYTGTSPATMTLVARTRLALNGLAYRRQTSSLVAIGSAPGSPEYNHLIGISLAGVTVDLGSVTGLPRRPWFTGDIDPISGEYFVGDRSDLYSINLATKVATKVPLPVGASIGADIIVVGPWVYTVRGGRLQLINVSTMTVTSTSLAGILPSDSVGSLWVNWSNGTLWMKVNRTGAIYSISSPSSTPVANLISTGFIGAGVDGASIPPQLS